MRESLRISARLAGPISLRSGALRLDGLLAWAVAQSEQIPPPGFGELAQIDIPIAKEPGGRFHLCSFAAPRLEQHELRYINRRFPVPEAQAIGDPKFKRINIAAGPTKSFRLPSEVAWVEHDELEWFAIGEAKPIRELLSLVHYLGHKRSVGRGKVRQWSVEPCEPWGPGFPIVRDGKPTRALPPDWPGLEDPELAYAVMSFPYWRHTAEELCAVP
ncbi:MAG TPA: hypothetical protein VFU97_24375 [Xanthobacteraceae bacterium]|nr:hypothetical protein [Xanthobacteraceae bacterium]